MEVARDVAQRDVHHRRVEEHHREPDRAGEENEALAPRHESLPVKTTRRRTRTGCGASEVGVGGMAGGPSFDVRRTSYTMFDASRTMGLAMTTELIHPPATDLGLAAVLHALSDPVRLNIVRTLATEGERTCGTFEVAVSKSTLSHHFRVLREAGVTLTEPTRTQRVVSLRRDDLDARFPGLLSAVLAAAPAPA